MKKKVVFFLEENEGKRALKNEGLFVVFENLRFYNTWKASSTTFLDRIR